MKYLNTIFTFIRIGEFGLLVETLGVMDGLLELILTLPISTSGMIEIGDIDSMMVFPKNVTRIINHTNSTVVYFGGST